jgi:hypothetical protein
MKDTEWSGLEKIPDELLIQTLRIELGKQNTYVIELEEVVKLKQSEKEAIIMKMNYKNSLLSKEIEKLNLTDKDNLNKIVDLTKRNELLHKQLMQLLKQTHP